MFDAATLGFAIDLAHKAGRDRRVMDAAEITRIVETAKNLAKGGIAAEAVSEMIGWAANQDPDDDDLKALLTIRNEGPVSKDEVADKNGWFLIRSISAVRRLSAQSFIEVYETGYFVITDKGRARLREAGLIGGEAPKPPARDPGACRFPPSWGQELGD